MLEVLDWLNVENGSILSTDLQYKIGQFYAADQDNPRRRELTFSLIRDADRLANPYERAELQVVCAAFLYLGMEFPEAQLWTEQARAFFETAQDAHRIAVTSWMLYFILRARCDFKGAFLMGRTARKIFLIKETQYARQCYGRMEDWYRQHAFSLTRSLVQLPEDVHEWLYEFNGSRLNSAALAMREHLRRSIEMNKFELAEKEAQALVDLSRSTRESAVTGEALACRGTAEWLMDRRMNAIYYYREALAHLLQNTHEYALLTWMLGLAQYAFPNLRVIGLNTLQRGVDLMARLRITAGRQNALDRSCWYGLMSEAMRCELKALV